MSATGEMGRIGFTLRLLRNMHSVLLSDVRGASGADAGNFRKKDVYIGAPGNPEAARFVPPKWQDVEAHLQVFEAYANSNDKDAIVQLAILHAQFEIIHPFNDGNGRMGRIIMPLFLCFKGVLSSPMLYLSEYFESDRDNYYERLQAITDRGEWAEWIAYFLRAVIEQSSKNIEKAKRVQALHDARKQTMRDVTKSRYSIDALDCIFHMPVFNTAVFKKRSGIPAKTADRILKELVKSGVIDILERGAGVRPTIYAFPELLAIVES